MPDFNKPRLLSVNGIRLAVYEEYPAGEPHPWPVILCHGMPELAYSWRHQFDVLVKAGFHVIAPDTRGGRQVASVAGQGRLHLAKTAG